MLLQRSVSWRQSNEPLLTIIFTFSRNSPKFTRSTFISSTTTRFLRSAHIFSRSTKQIHGQGGDYFFPWEREHTRRIATSYLLFLHILFLWAGFPCLLFLVPVAVLSILRYLLRAIERSLFALRARLPRFCGYCFFITELPHPFSDTPLPKSCRFVFLSCVRSIT